MGGIRHPEVLAIDDDRLGLPGRYAIYNDCFMERVLNLVKIEDAMVGTKKEKPVK